MNDWKILAAIFIILLHGCATHKGDWKDAKGLNTISSYQEFLKKHPQSTFKSEAEDMIQKLDWEKAQRVNKASAYQTFLRKYPQSTFENKAKSRILELDREKTQGINTINAYQEFLNKYPQSTLKSKAEDMILKLAWGAVQTANTVEAYKRFLKKYPQSGFELEAKIIIKEKEENSKRKEVLRKDNYKAYVKYLEDNPNSPFIKEIRDKLDKYVVQQIKKDVSYQLQGGSVHTTSFGDMTYGLDDQGASVYRGYFRIAGLEVDGVARLFDNGILIIEGGSTLYKY